MTVTRHNFIVKSVEGVDATALVVSSEHEKGVTVLNFVTDH